MWGQEWLQGFWGSSEAEDKQLVAEAPRVPTAGEEAAAAAPAGEKAPTAEERRQSCFVLNCIRPESNVHHIKCINYGMCINRTTGEVITCEMSYEEKERQKQLDEWERQRRRRFMNYNPHFYSSTNKD